MGYTLLGGILGVSLEEAEHLLHALGAPLLTGAWEGRV